MYTPLHVYKLTVMESNHTIDTILLYNLFFSINISMTSFQMYITPFNKPLLASFKS